MLHSLKYYLGSKHTHSFHIFSSAGNIPVEKWNAILNNGDVFLSLEYLKALETTLNTTVCFYYAIVYDKNQKPEAIAVFQIAPFLFLNKSQPKAITSNLVKDSKGRFSSIIMVCGNVFAAGEHGFLTSKGIDPETTMLVLRNCSKEVRIKYDALYPEKRISGTLFKEFFPQTKCATDFLKEKGFLDFEIDVNMILPISSEWKTIEDYFDDVKAKYRTKAKSVFKKSKELEIKSCSPTEILAYKNEINVLFNNVISSSDYMFGVMTADCFAVLKENLKEKFSFTALFYKNQIIGFSTAFLNGNVLEANYVGFDYDLNVSKGIYQRLLYDYISQAIENKVLQIHLGRTSELLKSSLGAVPVPMVLYAKHSSKLKNFIMAGVLKKLSASPYELRKPFKAKYYNK